MSSQAVSSIYIVDEEIAKTLSMDISTSVPTDTIARMNLVTKQHSDIDRALAKNIARVKELNRKRFEAEQKAAQQRQIIEQIEQERQRLQSVIDRQGKQRQTVSTSIDNDYADGYIPDPVYALNPVNKNQHEHFMWEPDWIIEDQIAKSMKAMRSYDIERDHELAFVLNIDEELAAQQLADQFAKDHELAIQLALENEQIQEQIAKDRELAQQIANCNWIKNSLTALIS